MLSFRRVTLVVVSLHSNKTLTKTIPFITCLIALLDCNKRLKSNGKGGYFVGFKTEKFEFLIAAYNVNYRIFVATLYKIKIFPSIPNLGSVEFCEVFSSIYEYV